MGRPGPRREGGAGGSRSSGARRGGGVVRPSGAEGRNVLQGVMHSQLTGRAPRSLRSLPAPVQRRLESQTHGMSRQCMDLEAQWLAGDLEACRTLVSSIYRSVRDTMGHAQQRNRDSFVLCGAEVLFIRVLSSSFSDIHRLRAPPRAGRGGAGAGRGQDSAAAAAAAASLGAMRGGVWPSGGALGALGAFGGVSRTEARNARAQQGAGAVRPIAERLRGMDLAARGQGQAPGAREERILWQMRADCLAALRELCFSSPIFSESLSGHRNLLIRLFTLMEHPATFDYGERGSPAHSSPVSSPPLSFLPCFAHPARVLAQSDPSALVRLALVFEGGFPDG